MVKKIRISLHHKQENSIFAIVFRHRDKGATDINEVPCHRGNPIIYVKKNPTLNPLQETDRTRKPCQRNIDDTCAALRRP